MKRFILTGAPGSGKTAIIRQLEIEGFGVVEEAATDVIALEQARGIDEPWMQPSFIDAIVHLQQQRLKRATNGPPDEIYPSKPMESPDPLNTSSTSNWTPLPLPTKVNPPPAKETPASVNVA